VRLGRRVSVLNPSLIAPSARLAERGSAAVSGRQGSSFCACAGFVLAQSAASASAIEPLSSSEPQVLREPAQITDVVDALDGNSGIDLHFTLGYQHTWKRAAVWRETRDPAVNPGAEFGIARGKVADYAENVSRLNVRGELGIYHDLALIARLPIVLSRVSTLTARSLEASALSGAPGEALFALPLSSPNRSGVEYLGVGVDWGILNQWRDASTPTLVVGVEGRFSVSEPMHACDGARCAYPGDINRNGVGGEFVTELAPGRSESLEGNFPSAARKSGVSRGTTSLELHSQVSRRFRYLEPYVGMNFMLESPNDDSDFGGSRPWNAGPPTRAGFSVGTEIMPWEVVERFQRLSFDLRLSGTYHSDGQDYSELFDALGSASAESYRRPNFAGYVANPDAASQAAFPSVVNPDSERVFPTGLTEIQGHGAYALRVTARWQAGQYVHFDAGGALSLTESHWLTSGQPCDGERAVDSASAGPCVRAEAGTLQAIGAPDPTYRPEVDVPGRRFFVDTASTIDAWVGATVMF
jgi:hypothetical protein